MSISNLQYPNQYNIYANDITCNALTAASISGASGPVDFSNITIASTGPQTIPALQITNTDTTNQETILITGTNPSMTIDMRDNNASAITNGLQTFNQNGNLKFQCGNNNSDNTAFLFSSSDSDLKFGVGPGGLAREVIRILGTGAKTANYVFNGAASTTGNLHPYSWIGTTTDGATQVQVLSIPLAAATDATIEVTCQGYVTVGALLNASLSRKIIISALNPGSGTAINGTTSVSSLNGTGLNAAAVSGNAIGSNIQIQIVGVAANTIQWTGVAINYT